MATTEGERVTVPEAQNTAPGTIEAWRMRVARWGGPVGSVLARLWRIPAVRAAVGLWAATRAVMLVLTWFGVLFTTTRSNLPDGHPSLTAHDFISHWWIWDSGWYVIISQSGYTAPAEGSYFPLYPLLIHLITGISRSFDPLTVALMISNIGTLLAFIAIALLANHDAGDDTEARYTLRALAAYPLALYLFAAYSEGIFLACAAWAMLGARRGWWPVAAGAGMLAGLARPFALALVLPLLWEFGRQHGWWTFARRLWAHRRQWRAELDATFLPRAWWRTGLLAIPVVAAPLMGMGIYAVYCARIFHDPLVFIHANGHGKAAVWDGITLAFHQLLTVAPWSYPQARMLVDLLPLALACVLTLVTVRRIPFAYSLYLMGVCAICLGTPYVDAIFPDVYVSAGRYLVVAFPLFMLIGRWTRNRPWLETLVINGGWAVQGMLLIFLFNGGWLV